MNTTMLIEYVQYFTIALVLVVLCNYLIHFTILLLFGVLMCVLCINITPRHYIKFCLKLLNLIMKKKTNTLNIDCGVKVCDMTTLFVFKDKTHLCCLRTKTPNK